MSLCYLTIAAKVMTLSNLILLCIVESLNWTLVSREGHNEHFNSGAVPDCVTQATGMSQRMSLVVIQTILLL